MVSVADQEAWLRLGAVEKAASVLSLAHDPEIADVLEVGCGTGAILEQLDRRGFAKSYWACEPSPSLFERLEQKRSAIPRLAGLACATLEERPFAEKQFDLVILSHVLEHVLDPARLLSAALDRGRFVLIEVPLEGNVPGELRSRIRRKITGKPRTLNPAGHVQFFSRADATKLVEWTGAEVMRSRLYYPTAQVRFQADTDRLPRRLYSKAILAAERLLGGEFLARTYYGHYALLVGKSRTPNAGAWGHEFYALPRIAS
jgi:SAM-dependent methyltransferase